MELVVLMQLDEVHGWADTQHGRRRMAGEKMEQIYVRKPIRHVHNMMDYRQSL